MAELARPKRWKVAAAYAWRGLWKADDTLRAAVWGRKLGFELRPRAAAGVGLAETRVLAAPTRAWRPPAANTSVAGLIGPRGLTAVAGRYFGLSVEPALTDAAERALVRAGRSAWPLVVLDASAGLPPGDCIPAAVAYVEAGGTLFIDHLGVNAAPMLDRLEAVTGRALPRAVSLSERPADVVFDADHGDFAAEFAGVAVQGHDGSTALSSVAGAEVLAWVRVGVARHPAVAQVSVGRGRIVLSVGAEGGPSLLAALAPPKPLAVLPTMMLMKECYGARAWHGPFALATCVIDDPALRGGRLGLDYDRTLEQARAHGFHVSIATIPRELELADPRVVDLLQRNGEWISACYHGSDHSGYEFFLPEGGGLRYRTRPLAAQVDALTRAVRRGESFARRTGLALDRVMVFPFGVGTAEILPSLQRAGFVAACNYDDRYPLGAPIPADFDLGLRAADVGWAGFPLLWRRGLPDRLFVLDLFLGRPAITFGHPRALGPDLSAFAARAEEIRRVADVRWTSLEDVARHAYLVRFDSEAGWRVRMLSNEICLHNSGEMARTYTIERPHTPHGFAVDAPRVTVPPGGCRVVRMVGAGAASLTPGRGCTVTLGQMPKDRAETA